MTAILMMWAWRICASVLRPFSRRLGWLAASYALHHLHEAMRLNGSGISELDEIKEQIKVAERQAN